MSAHRGRPGRGFARRDALHTWSLHFGPNMTPMVDVVMVILVFFMASAAFLGNEWFLRAAIPFNAGRGTALNTPSDPLALPPTRITVTLAYDPAGRRTVVTFLELGRATLADFEARVRAFPPDSATAAIELAISAAPEVPYNDVVRVLSVCDSVGISKVSVAVGGK
jgi:biopolymer transport protein ExbD